MKTIAFRIVLNIAVLSVVFFNSLSEQTRAEERSDLSLSQLRCEYLKDPVGIDIAKPRFCWLISSTTRGQKQTAYRVLVAGSAAKLAANEGDLWDSGKVAGDSTIHIVYEGKPLQTRMQCFWKVQVWDKDGKPSPWSEAASWSMGLLNPADWQQAQWIAADDPVLSIVTPHNGYHSGLAASADQTKNVAVDLGQSQPIDAVQLYPARPFDFTDTPGFLFPVRFKIEAAEKADFSDAKTVVDQTGGDVANPGVTAPIYRFSTVPARYVRLTVTRLGHRDGNNFAFALAEMQVWSAEKNVALNAKVLADDVIESGGWSKDRLVDGRLLPVAGTPSDPERPSSMVRKEFNVEKKITRATVSVTGLGLYELHLNGQKVGDHLLAPEWTRFCKRIQYQTYDVTDLVRQGKNAIGAQMGGGWWTGPMMLLPPLPNPQFCLRLRLDVELADGSVQTLYTDPSWQGTTDGPIRHSGIYFGEKYDATKEMPGWDLPDFQAQSWKPVLKLPHPDQCENPTLSAQSNEPIRVVKELKPIAMTEPKPGVFIFDMGQNMVGWCRLTADAPAGTRITLRYAEALNDDGTIYTANLRGAAQINEYTWRGGKASLEPHFTYHGFRYVEVTGLPQKPAMDDVLGRVFHSAAPDAGQFTCSDDLLNKIMHCVEWVQRGNMHSAPTDCPQRTEREGWMGDIQAFSQTGIFERDMAAFFTKWIPDVRDSQADDGRYPDIAPHVADPNKGFSGVPAWGDAGTVIPWRMYQNYGDTRMLEQHFVSAKRWIEFIRSNNPNLLWQKNRGNDYGDWLNGDTLILQDYPHGISEIPKEVFATAFFAHSTEIVAKMAKVLDRKDEAAQYAKLFEDIKAAFNKAYVAADGRIQGDTQAGYALALHFHLLPDSLRPKAMEYMLEGIKKYKDHPSTGIESTHRMLLELSNNGRHDEAYRLATLRTVPSWGYMVDMGATTIWERWDGYVKGRGFQNPGMNSLNHWAFGSIGEWVWRELAGINLDEAQPGYKHFMIRPLPCGDLAWVKAEYQSIRGPIVSDWDWKGEQFRLRVKAPANTTATVYVPAKDAAAVSVNDQPASQADGVKFIGMEDKRAVFEIVSGEYVFQSDVAR